MAAATEWLVGLGGARARAPASRAYALKRNAIREAKTTINFTDRIYTSLHHSVTDRVVCYSFRYMYFIA